MPHDKNEQGANGDGGGHYKYEPFTDSAIGKFRTGSGAKGVIHQPVPGSCSHRLAERAY